MLAPFIQIGPPLSETNLTKTNKSAFLKKKSLYGIIKWMVPLATQTKQKQARIIDLGKAQ